MAVVGAAGLASAAVRVTAAAGPAAVLGVPRPATGATGIAALPVAVQVPAIGVDSRLVTLGLDAEGALETPPYELAGWYGGGPKPGQVGAAVIAAHVDSKTGPAVFFRLRDLRPGDAVSVAYDDGSTVSFVVTDARTYPKSQFPTRLVYGPTAGPELRLITCSGAFDRRSGSYQDNLVVWAAPAGPGSAGPGTAA